jgi:hypothetical protein
MARMKRGAKSQAILDYIANNPDAGPKAIVDGLKAKGITVKPGLVSNIKYSKRSKGRKKKRLALHVAARRTKSTGLTVDQLIEVKRLADLLGGVAALRQAVDMLDQLR